MSCPSSEYDWPHTFFDHQLPSNSSSPQQSSYSTNPYNEIGNYHGSTMMTITDSIITTSSYGGATEDMALSQLSSSGAMISSTSPPSSSATSSKPAMKKRSRATKKTPTTLVNADSTNFRSLVQQFTGCPTPSSSSLMSAGPYKGPLNINFAQGDEDDDIRGVQEQYRLNSSAKKKNSAPFGLLTSSSSDGYGYGYPSSNIYHEQEFGFPPQNNRASADDYPAGSYMGSFDQCSSDNVADCGGSLSVEDYFDWGTTGSSASTFAQDFK